MKLKFIAFVVFGQFLAISCHGEDRFVEMELALVQRFVEDDLPATVQKALKMKYGSHVVDNAELYDDDEDAFYEVQLTTMKGITFVVEVGVDGQIISASEITDDSDDDDDTED